MHKTSIKMDKKPQILLKFINDISKISTKDLQKIQQKILLTAELKDCRRWPKRQSLKIYQHIIEIIFIAQQM
jgi:hypothetical protein